FLSSAIYVQRQSRSLQAMREMAGSCRPTDVGNTSTLPASSLAARPQASQQALLPKTFGIYVVIGEQLFELDQLPVRVPDQRLAMSAAINSPSHVNLPDGKVRFIVYRRDSASNALDRAEVRVIAKVVSAMTFEKAGKPTVTATADTWVIRNVSIGYRVAPIK